MHNASKISFPILWSLCLALTACQKKEPASVPRVEGSYTGIFEREGQTSPVELTLAQGRFHGQSEQDRFPAICPGSYELRGQSIHFRDSCLWTADFDWSLILKGEWQYTLHQDTLRLHQAKGDRYTLTQK